MKTFLRDASAVVLRLVCMLLVHKLLMCRVFDRCKQLMGLGLPLVVPILAFCADITKPF